MNVRKRGLALLMCICMIFTLLPFSAFADGTSEPDVVYGKYDNGTWTRQVDMTADSSAKNYKNNATGADVTYSKTAVSKGNDTYDVTLKIESKTSSTAPGASAIVLVIDISTSMYYCTECGNQEYHKENCSKSTGTSGGIFNRHGSEVKTEDTRLYAAKNASVNFVNSYKGNIENAGRYIQLVAFDGYAYMKLSDWIDVSVAANATEAIDSINRLTPPLQGNGTNLEQGLSKAKSLITSAPNGIAKDKKFAVVLTDGEPNRQGSDSSSRKIKSKTDAAAEDLKSAASVYTVCFGAESTRSDELGMTVGAYLSGTVASNPSNAFNANSAAELNKAFEDIFKSIEQGLSSGFTVTDPMGKYIQLQDASLTDCTINKGTITWTPTTGEVSEKNGVKTYTYTLTYTVKLDTSADGFVDNKYYATNDVTTLAFKDGDNDITREFNVPGVKGTAPKYNVTYKFEGNYPDSVTVPASEQHKAGETVTMPEITAPEGWIFNGWKYDSNPVTSVEMPAGDITIIGTFTEQKAYTVKYLLKGTDISVKDAVTGIKNVGDSVSAVAPDLAGYTFAGTDADKNQTITVVSDASQNVITFYYYKNVTVTAKNDTKVYGNDDPAAFAADVTGTRDNETVVYTVARGDGEDVGAYVITPTGDEIQGYYKVEYKNGSFEITVRQVILTGESATRTYTGQEIELTGIEQSGLLDGHTFSGVSYSAKGTNASATPYPGEFSNMDKLVIKDADGNDVTKNYKPEYALGALTINPIGTVTVTIKGKTVTGVYCGADYIAEGYDVEISDPKYTKDDFTFSGNSQVYRTDVGTTYMGLKAEQFENKNSNFDRVEFVIEEDGYVEVTKRPLYLRADTPNPITYDGAEHVRTLCVVVAKGEYLEIANGQMLENVLTMYRVSGTNVGIYKGEFLQLAKIVDRDDPSKDVTANYDIKYETGTLQITKMPITITAGSAEGAYILGPITSNEWKATATAEGDTVSSVKLTGAQTTLGESPNVASDAVIKNAKGEDVTANYEITYVDGLLKGIELLEKEIHFNYVIGYTDGTIRPGNNISRAEVATIFFRLLTDEAREQYNKTTTSYSDIKDGAWCCRAVATLTNADVINGYTDGTFRPNAPITRAELATIIARFAKLDVNTKTFSDINGHWAQKSIELAAGNNWINGYDDGTFRPNNNITRAETFAMINRVLDRQTESVSDLLPTSEMNMWSDNMNENAWYYKDVQEATNYHKCDRVGDSVYEKWTEKVPDIDWASYQI